MRASDAGLRDEKETNRLATSWGNQRGEKEKT